MTNLMSQIIAASAIFGALGFFADIWFVMRYGTVTPEIFRVSAFLIPAHPPTNVALHTTGYGAGHQRHLPDVQLHIAPPHAPPLRRRIRTGRLYPLHRRLRLAHGRDRHQRPRGHVVRPRIHDLRVQLRGACGDQTGEGGQEGRAWDRSEVGSPERDEGGGRGGDGECGDDADEHAAARVCVCASALSRSACVHGLAIRAAVAAVFVGFAVFVVAAVAGPSVSSAGSAAGSAVDAACEAPEEPSKEGRSSESAVKRVVEIG